MSDHTHILKWATDPLILNGYSLQQPPEVMQLLAGKLHANVSNVIAPID